MLTNQRYAISGIILSRFSDELTVPSDLSNFLVSEGFTKQQAEALSWGEDNNLTSQQINWLAQNFNLDYELLSSLMIPTSLDVVEHILIKIVKERFYSENCSRCYQLEELIFERGADTVNVALEVLEHLDISEHESSDEELVDFDFDDLDQDSPLIQSLVEVSNNLTKSQQVKLLTYACKLATEDNKNDDTQYLEAVQLLQEILDDSLTCRVLDHLAVSERGQLNSKVLLDILHLDDKRSLSQIQRTIKNGLIKLEESGINIPMPLKIDSQNSLYIITIQFKQAWLAVMRAKGNSLVAIEDDNMKQQQGNR
jgi:hypothetical protein